MRWAVRGRWSVSVVRAVVLDRRADRCSVVLMERCYCYCARHGMRHPPSSITAAHRRFLGYSQHLVGHSHVQPHSPRGEPRHPLELTLAFVTLVRPTQSLSVSYHSSLLAFLGPSLSFCPTFRMMQPVRSVDEGHKPLLHSFNVDTPSSVKPIGTSSAASSSTSASAHTRPSIPALTGLRAVLMLHVLVRNMRRLTLLTRSAGW